MIFISIRKTNGMRWKVTETGMKYSAASAPTCMMQMYSATWPVKIPAMIASRTGARHRGTRARPNPGTVAC